MGIYKKIIADFFAKKSLIANDKVWDENACDNNYVVELLKPHLPTQYNQAINRHYCIRNFCTFNKMNGVETLNYPLNNQQLHLLKMFSKDLPNEDWENVTKLLSEYFAGRLMDEMDKAWYEKGWTNETMEEFKNGHFRISANAVK